MLVYKIYIPAMQKPNTPETSAKKLKMKKIKLEMSDPLELKMEDFDKNNNIKVEQNIQQTSNKTSNIEHCFSNVERRCEPSLQKNAPNLLRELKSKSEA